MFLADRYSSGKWKPASRRETPQLGWRTSMLWPAGSSTKIASRAVSNSHSVTSYISLNRLSTPSERDSHSTQAEASLHMQNDDIVNSADETFGESGVITNFTKSRQQSFTT